MKNKLRSHSKAFKMNKADNSKTLESDREKEVDDMLVRTIQALDLFIAQSNNLKIGTIARILHNAKEELVYWAASLDFHETRSEALINRLLYANSLFATLDCLRLNPGSSGD